MITAKLKQNITEFDIDGMPAVRIDGLTNFIITQIFDCGQCFRFDPVANPRHEAEFEGVAHGRYIRFGQDTPDSVTIYNTTVSDYEQIWKHYLALDADYGEIRRDIAARFADATGGRDTVMPRAMEYGDGIRILRQDPWEAVCSFIVSQNNNIPRIKKIISAMSRAYGEPILCGGSIYHAFPTAEALVNAGEQAIFDLKTGFRAKYIYDAAKKAASGELDFSAITAAVPDKAEELLCTVKGVGPKVAACAMLFGFDKTEAFPIDVWIKRVLAKYYPDGLDISALGKYAGIAQQYLFYYERYNA
ncbi:MAG: DNA-3-methyladenine glycosylase 2 family protein [Clostridia bacterium]|nr:DNA-3-methyladenine glycosylase 2 family protein [Clostridia bacterium]